MNNNIEVMKSVWRRVERPSAVKLRKIKAIHSHKVHVFVELHPGDRLEHDDFDKRPWRALR